MLYSLLVRKLTVGLSWDKAIGKNIKSIDKKDIGKIKQISKDFIQIDKGLVSKDHYFVPKYFVEGYDENDDIIISLTEDEIKNKFMNESNNPSGDILDDDNYKQRKESLNKKHPNFDDNIPQFSPVVGSGNDQDSTSEGAQMSWEKVLGKEVKSSDKKEIGKIKSVGEHFVEVEDGVVSKKRYFISKKHLHKYDGDKVYSSLSKDEISQKYQRDSPPLDTELEHMDQGEKDHELIPSMAQEPGLEIKTSSMDEGLKIAWDEIIHKHVRAADNVDLGDVDKVGNEFIVVREGFANVHLYYIPKKYIIKYDGSSLWLNLSSTLASAKFERKNEPSEEEMENLLNQ